MNQDETIEILMATYNGEKYISEQIDSIINQTYKNWKLLIRDDGSKDKTLEILKKYQKKDKRINILRDTKGNLGFVKNFEELLKNSSEEFVMFSDQDDYWLENKIELYINELSRLSEIERKNPLLLHSNSFICDENLNIKKKEFVNSKVASQYEESSYFFTYIVQGSTTLVNKRLIDIGLPFLRNVTLHDRYFHLLAEFLGKRVFINKSLLKYRQHSSNEIGAKGSIIQKILKKRYFDKEDRELIVEIQEKYKNKILEKQLGQIEKYLKITDRKRNRFMRFLLSLDFKINLKKRIFFLFKG